jgi:hypothetical protein
MRRSVPASSAVSEISWGRHRRIQVSAALVPLLQLDDDGRVALAGHRELVLEQDPVVVELRVGDELRHRAHASLSVSAMWLWTLSRMKSVQRLE